MPAELLVDLAQLDPHQVALSREEVGAILPQTGDMRQLDWVTHVSAAVDLAIGVKQVRDDEFWVEGHIPGRPLFPGVLMIEAAAQLSSVLYRLKIGNDSFVGFTRCDGVAFRGQVVPGDRLDLVARELEFKPRRFVCQTQGLVGGRLVFEAKITGMNI